MSSISYPLTIIIRSIGSSIYHPYVITYHLLSCPSSYLCISRPFSNVFVERRLAGCSETERIGSTNSSFGDPKQMFGNHIDLSAHRNRRTPSLGPHGMTAAMYSMLCGPSVKGYNDPATRLKMTGAHHY